MEDINLFQLFQKQAAYSRKVSNKQAVLTEAAAFGKISKAE